MQRQVDLRLKKAFLLSWLIGAAAAAALLALAVAAADSGGFDRLLPKDEPFIPYFTT